MTREEEAELYALVQRGNAGDLDFYERHCAGATSILELGCGSGRVLRALRERVVGREHLGLDLDPGLLGLARRADPEIHWVRGDMARWALGRRFDRILVPFGGLYCLLDEKRLLACLGAIAAHLEPAGQLIFDVYEADAFHSEDVTDTGEGEEGTAEDAEEERPVTSIPHRGEQLHVSERTRWTRDEQRLDVVYVYRRGGAEGEIVAELPLPQRYLLANQIAPHLETVGLEVRAFYSDPEQHPGEGSGLPAEPYDSDWRAVVAGLRGGA